MNGGRRLFLLGSVTGDPTLVLSLFGDACPSGDSGYLIVLQPQISDGYKIWFVVFLALFCEDGSNTVSSVLYLGRQ